MTFHKIQNVFKCMMSATSGNFKGSQNKLFLTLETPNYFNKHKSIPNHFKQYWVNLKHSKTNMLKTMGSRLLKTWNFEVWKLKMLFFQKCETLKLRKLETLKSWNIVTLELRTLESDLSWISRLWMVSDSCLMAQASWLKAQGSWIIAKKNWR